MNEHKKSPLHIQVKCGVESWSFSVTGDRFMIGRSRLCDISLPIANLSRRHLEISRSDSGAWSFSDVGSSQGTTWNGAKLEADKKFSFHFPLTLQVGASLELEITLLDTQISAPDMAPSVPANSSQGLKTEIERLQSTRAAEIALIENAFLKKCELEDACSELHVDVKELQRQRDDLSTELAARRLQLEELGTVEEKIRLAVAQLDELVREHQIKSTETEAIKLNLQKLWERREERQAGLENIDQLTVQKQQSLRDTEAEIEKLTKAGAAALATSAQAKLDFENIQKMSKALNTENDALASTILSAKAEAEAAMAEQSVRARELQTLSESHASLLLQATPLEQNLKQKTEQVDRLSAELELLRQETAKLLIEQTELGSLVSSLTATQAGLRERTSSLEGQAQKLEAANEALKILNDQLLSQKAASETACETSALKLSSQTDLLADINKQVELSLLVLQSLKAEMAVCVAKHDEKQKSLTELETRSVKIENQKRQLQAELAETEAAKNAALAAFEQERRDHQTSIDAMHAEFAAQKKQAEAKLQAEFITKAEAQNADLAKQKKSQSDLIEKERSEWQRQRTEHLPSALKEIQRATKNLFAAHFKVLSAEHPSIDEIGGRFCQDLQDVIRTGMGSDRADLRLDAHIKSIGVSSPGAQVGAKKYWLKRGVQVGVVASLALFGLIFPSVPMSMVASLEQIISRKPASSDAFVEQVRVARQGRPKFLPEQSKAYRDSYTDNLIYLVGYAALKSNDQIKSKWTLELNKFFIHDLDLDDRVIVNFMALEGSLITELKAIGSDLELKTYQQKISRMHDFEAIYTPRFVALLGSDAAYKKFRAFESSFYQQNIRD